MSDPVQIVARGPRAQAEAAAAVIDASPLLEGATYSIIEEDEDRGVWRIDAFPISDEEAGPIKDYVKHVNPSFTILQDKTQAASGAWMVTAIPELAVIDTKGVVVFATMGAGSYLEEALSFADKLEAAH